VFAQAASLNRYHPPVSPRSERFFYYGPSLLPAVCYFFFFHHSEFLFPLTTVLSSTTKICLGNYVEGCPAMQLNLLFSFLFLRGVGFCPPRSVEDAHPVPYPCLILGTVFFFPQLSVTLVVTSCAWVVLAAILLNFLISFVRAHWKMSTCLLRGSGYSIVVVVLLSSSLNPCTRKTLPSIPVRCQVFSCPFSCSPQACSTGGNVFLRTNRIHLGLFVFLPRFYTAPSDGNSLPPSVLRRLVLYPPPPHPFHTCRH